MLKDNTQDRKKIALGTLLVGFLFIPFSVAHAASTFRDLVFLALGILNQVTVVLVALAVVIFIFGVVRYVSKGDSEEERKKGRNLMIWGIIAIFVIVSVWGFVNILANTLNLPTQTPPAPLFPGFGGGGPPSGGSTYRYACIDSFTCEQLGPVYTSSSGLGSSECNNNCNQGCRLISDPAFNCIPQSASGGGSLCGNGRIDSGEDCDGPITGATRVLGNNICLATISQNDLGGGNVHVSCGNDCQFVCGIDQP
jgi:uncharacterized membrane protein YidH (DUF202 family)